MDLGLLIGLVIVPVTIGYFTALILFLLNTEDEELDDDYFND